MIDELTKRLHAGTEGMPTSLRSPAGLRREAERGRRIRQTIGFTVVAVVTVGAVMVGARLTDDVRTSPRPNPATTRSPNTTPGVFTFVSEPLLKGSDWGFPEDRSGGQPPQLMECIGDAHTLGPTRLLSAKYVVRGSSAARFNNEFLLWFDDEARATRALSDLRSRLTRCHKQQTQPPFLQRPVGYTLVEPIGPIDEIVEGAGFTTAADVDMGLPAGPYQIYAARDQNVVVVIESYEGWGDRPSRMLELALERAIPTDQRECRIVVCVP